MNDKPASRYLRNPYLLTLICDVALDDDTEIENFNLQSILQAHVQRSSTERHTAQQSHHITEMWLPRVALTMKKDALAFGRLEEQEDPESIAQARAMGLLRGHANERTVQFVHGVLLDYFAAKQLALEMRTNNISNVISQYLPRNEEMNLLWGNVLRILTALSGGDEANELIEQIRTVDLRLAHQCLLEVPQEACRGMPAFETVTSALARRIRTHGDSDIDSRVADAEALGFLDPRIATDNALEGMLDVPSSGELAGFKIGVYPVANMEFARFVEGGGYETADFWSASVREWLRKHDIRYPKYWRNDKLNKPNYPVVGVCFYEALAYCRWLSTKNPELTFRLPTEMHWDRAAHGANSVILGMSLGRATSAIDQDESTQREKPDTDEIQQILSELTSHMSQHRPQMRHGTLTPVGVFAPNALGCFDLYGNVWQWCDTCLSILREEPSSTQDRLDCPVIVKGGPIKGSYDPASAVIGGWFDPCVRSPELGFRICSTET